MCADLCSAHIFLISERGAYPLFKPSQVGIAALSVAFGAVQALASVAVFVIDFAIFFFRTGQYFLMTEKSSGLFLITLSPLFFLYYIPAKKEYSE